MPTKTNRRGKTRWRGQVKIAGKIVTTKWFGSGRKEKQAAIVWEIEQKKILQEQQAQTPTDCLTLTVLEWANEYLNFAKTRYVPKTYQEKRDGFKRFVKTVQVEEPGMITPAVAMGFLSDQYKKRSGYAANKERKNSTCAGHEMIIVDNRPEENV